VFRIPTGNDFIIHSRPDTQQQNKRVQLFQLAAPSATLTSPIDFQLFKQTQLLLFYPVRVAHLSSPFESLTDAAAAAAFSRQLDQKKEKQTALQRPAKKLPSWSCRHFAAWAKTTRNPHHHHTHT
jgi:hypothetical protein